MVADYLARPTLRHLTGFNNQINTIRVLRAIFSPCCSLNLPRLLSGWCKSLFFFPVQYHCSRLMKNSWRLQRSKIKVCCGCVFTSRPMFSSLNTASLHADRALFTVNSLCLCHYNRKSWYTVVLVEEKGPTAESSDIKQQ